MGTYIGAKIIKATTQQCAEDIHKSKAGDPGYLVEYEDGYRSWSPKDVFEASYRRVDGMTFGLALESLKKGLKVARKGWNGKGMWLVLMPSLYLPPYNTQGTERKVNDRTAKWIGEDKPLDCQPYIVMWTASQQWQPGWLASQADMLADDWMVVE